RNKHNLLTRVFSNVKDQTKDIAIKLIDALGVAAANARAGQLNSARAALIDEGKTKIMVAAYEFDPFDHSEITEINRALRDFGYCLYLDPATDGYVPGWMTQQC